jgi:hypothetical protein
MSPEANPRPTRKGPPPLLVIAIVLAITAMVVLHLTGVLGPGSH